MTRRAGEISPAQSSSVQTGRVLIVFEQWLAANAAPCELERAMLLDFIVQHPRSFITLSPALEYATKAHGMARPDLSDAFARRQYSSLRETFIGPLGGLVSRGLVTQSLDPARNDACFAITADGVAAATRLRSRLAFGLRAIAAEVIAEWGRTKPSDLANYVRQTMPDESQAAEGLSQPFAQWLLDTEQ